eukprot:TRINITY_DN729_c0_g1_i5.p5 TRINITY_DN729_c0_g1~~TRINITY_DN729_c0_g1_i5.p5  ORF type:complete len:161 (-),score=5.45 TRINITY_DN729_c0_g1_i5:390-872(-)
MLDDGQKMLENYPDRTLLDVVLHSLHAIPTNGLADVVMTFSDQSQIEIMHEVLKNRTFYVLEMDEVEEREYCRFLSEKVNAYIEAKKQDGTPPNQQLPKHKKGFESTGPDSAAEFCRQFGSNYRMAALYALSPTYTRPSGMNFRTTHAHRICQRTGQPGI